MNSNIWMSSETTKNVVASQSKSTSSGKSKTSRTKSTNSNNSSSNKTEKAKIIDIPQKVSNCGLMRRLNFSLSEEQKEFAENIYDKDSKIIFCDSVAGTGKTTVAVATACAMLEFGMYEQIIYVFAPIGFDNIGFAPGSIAEKTSMFFDPCCQALEELGYISGKVIYELVDDPTGKANCFVHCVPHTFMRGINFSKSIIIVDESQNLYIDELRKVLTRVKDDCKIIVIGHHGQCDLIKHPENSGFIPYIQLFKDRNEGGKARFCSLTKNFRGWVSNTADNIVNNK